MTIEPLHLNSVAALIAAETTSLKKEKNEPDPAFVKRIVCSYFNALPSSEALDKLITQTLREAPS